jgi:hypothetical protein
LGESTEISRAPGRWGSLSLYHSDGKQSKQKKKKIAFEKTHIQAQTNPNPDSDPDPNTPLTKTASDEVIDETKVKISKYPTRRP